MFHLKAKLRAVLLTLYSVQGIIFNNCKNNKLEIYEDTPAVLTCGDINSNVKVVWKRDPGGNIGECDMNGHCTDDNFFTLSRSRHSTESQLTIPSDHRRYANVLVTCQEQRSFSTASCTLVIRRHSVLSDCQVTTNSVNWTVSGSCRVREAFTSDNNYSCTWTLIPTQRTFGEFSTNRELCSFSQPLESTEGVFNYIISVTPPSATSFSKEVRIVQPGDITTSCPHSVVSGRDLSCTCQTTNTASPPATVRWEGRDSEKLVKTNVQREDNGTQFTCHVTWAGRLYTSKTYTLLVNWTELVDDGLQPSSETFPYLLVIMAPGAVFVAVVIVFVIVIVIRRRRGKLKDLQLNDEGEKMVAASGSPNDTIVIGRPIPIFSPKERDENEGTLQPSNIERDEHVTVAPRSSNSVVFKNKDARKVFRRSDNTNDLYNQRPTNVSLRKVQASGGVQAAGSSCRLSMEPRMPNLFEEGPYTEIKDADTRPKSSKRHKSKGHVNSDRRAQRKKGDAVDVVRGRPVLRNQ